MKENDNGKIIILNARENYSKQISEIEENLNTFFTNFIEPVKKAPEEKNQVEKTDIEERGKEYLENYEEKEEVREHRYLQTFIKKLAEQRGFKASIEETVENGRVDVSLIKNQVRIACEIAVANSVEYEVKNINKCLNANYSTVCVVSKDEKHLGRIKEKMGDEFPDQDKVYFFNPDQMIQFLDSLIENEEHEVKRVRGYRVKVNYRAVE